MNVLVYANVNVIVYATAVVDVGANFSYYCCRTNANVSQCFGHISCIDQCCALSRMVVTISKMMIMLESKLVSVASRPMLLIVSMFRRYRPLLLYLLPSQNRYLLAGQNLEIFWLGQKIKQYPVVYIPEILTLLQVVANI